LPPLLIGFFVDLWVDFFTVLECIAGPEAAIAPAAGLFPPPPETSAPDGPAPLPLLPPLPLPPAPAPAARADVSEHAATRNVTLTICLICILCLHGILIWTHTLHDPSHSNSEQRSFHPARQFVAASFERLAFDPSPDFISASRTSDSIDRHAGDQPMASS
jgi:hypothetical protein